MTNISTRSPAKEFVSCLLILTRRAHAEVFLLTAEEGLRLPRIVIPKNERAAPHLVSQIKTNWNIDAVCLFRLQIALTDLPCYILEALSCEALHPNQGVWLSLDRVREAALGTEEVALLRSALSEAEAYQRGLRAGCFVSLGWLDEAMTWIQAQISPYGWRLKTSWTQYSIGPDFSLVRFETSGPAVWFKAAGGANQKEYAISSALAEIRSPHLPEFLAFHPGWHAWLMVEAEGRDLDEALELGTWQQAAKSLACLQLDSLSLSSSLLAAGCKDLRLQALDAAIDPLLAVVDDLMKAQTVRSPAPLQPHELESLALDLREACHQLQRSGLREALNHMDLNPGNVLATEERAVFLDWSEAAVGHPFFSLEYLVGLLRKLKPDRKEWVNRVLETYVAEWITAFPEERLVYLRRWTPLLAMLAFAVGCPGWRGGREGMHPNTQKLLRSLARRMYLEAKGGDNDGIRKARIDAHGTRA
jgi:Phosphotransferase enzyme family